MLFEPGRCPAAVADTISSRQNPLVARCRALATRRDPALGEALLDGEHLLASAAAASVPVEIVAVTDQALRHAGLPALLDALERRGARVVRVTAAVMNAMSPTRTPSGVLAIAHPPAHPLPAVFEPPPALAVILVGVQDPGNVGAVVRVADAAGATGVVAAGASADPLGWKALRGAMGSAFRLPVATCRQPDDVLTAARTRGVRLLAATPRDGRSLYDAALAGPIALVLGAEGLGLEPALAAAADEAVTIPMREGVESLNVAVAAGLVLYEARRQRHHA